MACQTANRRRYYAVAAAYDQPNSGENQRATNGENGGRPLQGETGELLGLAGEFAPELIHEFLNFAFALRRFHDFHGPVLRQNGRPAAIGFAQH